MFTSQEDVDRAFSDLDLLLASDRPVDQRGVCVCGGRVQRLANEGKCIDYYAVCTECGAVQADGYGLSDELYYPTRKSSSNYKRIHHWHERISQLLMCESRIPDHEFMQIAQCLLDGSHTVINKDVIRGVLRSLNMQLYIEKWLQIVQRVTGIEPPKPGRRLLQALDDQFIELQRPFVNARGEVRKNFLNYNYVFCRLFQQLGCPQFGMFFPLIKSKAKLRALDAMWCQMIESVGWVFTPLQPVAQFSVKLEQPELLLERLVSAFDPSASVARPSKPVRTVSRKSDQRILRELDHQRETKRRRSDPPESLARRSVCSVKRPRLALAKAPRSSHRS